MSMGNWQNLGYIEISETSSFYYPIDKFFALHELMQLFKTIFIPFKSLSCHLDVASNKKDQFFNLIQKLLGKDIKFEPYNHHYMGNLQYPHRYRYQL